MYVEITVEMQEKLEGLVRIETLGKRDLFIRFPEPLSDTLVARDIVEITFLSRKRLAVVCPNDAAHDSRVTRQRKYVQDKAVNKNKASNTTVPPGFILGYLTWWPVRLLGRNML